jgi:glycerol uptake operon antiterminator
VRNNHPFFEKIEANPIIAAISDHDMIDEAIASPSEIIFLLKGNILNLAIVSKKLKDSGKLVFVHVDLMEGLTKESVALEYISKTCHLDGIITTRTSLLKKAKELGLFTIQRLFLLDSLSLERGIHSVKHLRPDAVEILPGIVPKMTKYLTTELNVPIITGGLIKDKEDVIESINAGAVGISTTRKEIWYL